MLRLNLGALRDDPEELNCKDPGLLIIGAAAEGMFRTDTGALQGRRVLLTCSETIMEKAIIRVVDFGGRPLARPMIKLSACDEIQHQLAELASYDWLVLTSPASVRFFMEMVLNSGIDLRRLPRIMTCGPGSAQAFAPYGITPDLTPPMIYSAEGLAAALADLDFTGQRVLRLRSELAGTLLADVLRGKGALVDDELLYKNEFVQYPELPGFDIVFFASASAVDAYVGQAGAGSLAEKLSRLSVNPLPMRSPATACTATVLLIKRQSTVPSKASRAALPCVSKASHQFVSGEMSEIYVHGSILRLNRFP